MLQHILIRGAAVAVRGILAYSNLSGKKFYGIDNYLPVTGWTGNTFQFSKQNKFKNTSTSNFCGPHSKARVLLLLVSVSTQFHITVKLVSCLKHVKFLFPITCTQVPFSRTSDRAHPAPSGVFLWTIQTSSAFGCRAGQKFILTIKAILWGRQDPQPQQRCK